MAARNQRGEGGIELLVALVVTALICFAAYAVKAHACNQRATLMGLQHDYGFFQGCMVKVDDKRWAPIEYVRIVDGKVSIQGSAD